ncbi:uncharacterized protein LOC130719879 [Lotus japonicus]|uniref:uncharacterized protein LOC130719879 n=1 Tax=Lotus japonicus TaxID=34305 RepID=UPI002586DB67|nr:uncharacterized protein LOC130719879 [Lotus japonicus]
MASSNLPGVNLPILTDKNWDRWNSQMKVLFGFQDVLDVIENGFQPLTQDMIEEQKTLHNEMKKKDCKAMFLIHQCVDDTHFEKIANASSAKEMWDIIQKVHSGSDKVKKVKLQTLRRQYEGLQMEENEKVGEYFTKILTTVNLMKGCGEKITDVMVIEKIMRSLAPKFDYIVVAIEESKDVDNMKIEELQSSLEAHEMRLADRNSVKVAEQALKVGLDNHDGKKKKWTGKGKSDNKSKWSQGNSDKPESSKRRGESAKNGGNQRKTDKKNVECYKCHKMGHYSYECRAGKPKQQKNADKEAYATREDSDEDPIMLMVTTMNSTVNAETDEIWYLDSGCSNHMTSHNEWLVDLDKTRTGRVKFADNRTLQIKGKGDVVIPRRNGKTAVIKDVFYVPELKCNLMSIGQLVEKGYNFDTKNRKLHLYDPEERLVLNANLTKNKTFQVNMKAAEIKCFAAQEPEE